MKDFINVHQTYEKVIFTDQRVNNREFDGCVFKNCDFSNSDFSSNTFLDCEFYDCNLSNLNLRGTSLKQVHFENCKLLGIQFHECDDFLFAVDFNSCNVDYASFINKKMVKAKLINSSLREVNFTSADLTKATSAETFISLMIIFTPRFTSFSLLSCISTILFPFTRPS